MNHHRFNKTRRELEHKGMLYEGIRNEQGEDIAALTAKGATFACTSILLSICERAANANRDLTPEEIAEILANTRTLEIILRGGKP